MSVVDFLLARIAEDEQDARKCAEVFPSPWEVVDRGHMASVKADGLNFQTVAEVHQDQVKPITVGDGWLGDYLIHVATHDPERVLAECQAKREIVRMTVDAAVAWVWDESNPHETLDQSPEWVRRALPALASAYSSHPDYNPDWGTP